ncbi:MAG: patatin-like phospholipase family protein [Spirochaetales bacterium]
MKKWALVLSGGGGRGLVYVGVLRALEQLGLVPNFVAGTSIGAILGGLYCAGMTPGELHHFVQEEFDLRDYLEGITFRLGEGAFFRFLQAQEALTHLSRGRGIDSGKKILQVLQKLTKGKHFEDTYPPFACNAADLLTGKEIVLETGPLAEGIRASMSVPGIFTPVSLPPYLLVDGGILNNLPVRLARKRGYKRVLAINCSPFAPVKPEDLPTGISVFFRALSVAGNDRPIDPSYDIADLEIRIPQKLSEFDFSQKKELIQLGEITMRKAESYLKLFFKASLFPQKPQVFEYSP